MADGICVRCGNHRKLHGRRLCDPCYNTEQRKGTIRSYPTIPIRRMRTPLVCVCPYPLVERLNLWDRSQCIQCGRLITPDRIAELTDDEPIRPPD
jgi:NMD protein affecting ribosome stability and mRNA decay